jgi:transposase
LAAQQQTLTDYLHAVGLLDRRIESLERSLDEAAANGPWTGLVAKLRCMRGVDTLTALGIIYEIGEFTRFRTSEPVHGVCRPGANRALLRRVPAPRVDHERRQQHVRRLLVEAAWHGRLRPKVGYELARRQRDQDPLVIERAWRAQQRLHHRWWRMAGRGKPQQKIAVAFARELAGFVWAIATDQPPGAPDPTKNRPLGLQQRMSPPTWRTLEA